MVIVKRKSDGKFFVNRSLPRSWYKKEDRFWTNDPSECKPYANESGARWSFYNYVQVDRSKCTHFKLGEPTSWTNGKPYKWYSKDCACVKAVRKQIRAKFDAKYEIVPVSIGVARK